MTTSSYSVDRGGRLGVRRDVGFDGAPQSAAVIAVLSAAVLAYLAIDRPAWALMLAMGCTAVWLVARGTTVAALLGISLPLTMDISSGLLGLQIAASDLILSGLTLFVLARWAVTHQAPELGDLRPLAWVVGPYLAVLAVLLVAHPGVGPLVATGQRLELVAFPLIVGAALARQGRTQWLLGAYLVSASAVAGLWIAGVHLGQKNPAGQFIANGLILLLACKDLRRRFVVATPLLLTGLLWTQSRGAILSVLVGAVVLVLVQPGRARWRTVLLLVPAAVATYVAFQLIPEAAQQRNLDYGSGKGSAAQWSVYYRNEQHEQAWTLIHAHPVVGVGMGQYFAGDGYSKPTTADPHQVFLFEWAQGGVLLLGAFVVLILTPLAVRWSARGSPLMPAAAAITAAVMGHGYVDIYWVRGTPVLGWLLVGMALAQRSLRARTEAAPGGEPS